MRFTSQTGRHHDGTLDQRAIPPRGPSYKSTITLESDNTRTLRHTGHPGVTSDSSTVTAQPDSNTNGSVDPRRHRSGRYAARHGRWQIIKDPLGVKGSGLEPMSQIADDLRRRARGHTSLECGSS